MGKMIEESTTEQPEMQRGGKKRTIFFLLLLVAATSLVASVVLIAHHLTYKRGVMESVKSRLTSLTFQATLSIDRVAREVIDNGNSIADQLSSGALTPKAAQARIRGLLERYPHFLSSALSYKPYAFDPGRRLYSVLLAKKNGRIERIQLDKVYDYTKPEYDWFGAAIDNGPQWSQPFYGEASSSLLVAYSVPFYSKDKGGDRRSAMGVVTITISIDEIGRVIESLDLGPTGFGALVSQKGAYLYHPDTELVISRKTLTHISYEQSDRDRQILAEQAGKRGSGVLDHRSISTGLDSWLIYAPIPSTGWSMQNTFIKDDLPWDVDLLRRQLIWITIVLVIFASSAAVLLYRAGSGNRTRLWAASVTMAIFFAAGISVLWKISLSHNYISRNAGIRINDKAALTRIMNSYIRASSDRHTEAPVYIPTGIFIESATLSSAGDLAVSGYIWQKYRLGEQDAVPRAFTIGGASSLTMVEKYSIRENGYEILRWYVRCMVPQQIDHSKYPLEQDKLSLRILHTDMNHNVFLVPDLAAYNFINPTALPGLRKDLALPGWKIVRSFFELRKNIYNTNFGLERPLNKDRFPSLCFSFEIKRNFTDAFISNLTALIIVTILLFTLLMITSKDERRVSFMQVGSGRILNICASMFLVIAFSHVSIRRTIVVEQVFYLEYFFFLTYFIILLVSINSVLYAVNANIHLVQYRENLIPRLCYWPCLFALLFTISVFIFY
ncbi:MAG: hypothetical protein KKH22_04655 [Proteobacteria bacterium]|nr:hypothetical protein [Pseudomonadota bacterium]